MLWCLLFVLPYSALGIDNVVDTTTGKVRGTTVSQNGHIIQVFKGIPFAKPPVGDLRFRKTVPVDPWDGIRDATEFGPACIQSHAIHFPGVDYMPGQQEDCLNLNIWVPANTTKDSKKAVMFWIYGGSFSSGSNRVDLYNGGTIALADVLVVNINYRINVMGFLSTRNHIDKAPGNMALYDMMEALRWVNQNINAFGGDSNRITLFGESAGATSIGLLCISPLTKDLLFQRIIMQSSSPANDGNNATAHNLVLGQKLAESVGCASDSHSFETSPDEVIECLKTIRAEELVSKTSRLSLETGAGFLTVVGDDFLPKDPKQQLIAGDFRNPDLLIGHNQDEGSLALAGKQIYLLFLQNPRFTKTIGKFYIRDLFGCKFLDILFSRCSKFTEQVVTHYLGDVKEFDFVTVREQTYHSAGDYVIICPDTYFGESFAKKGNNVYAYYFNVIPSYSSFPFPRWMGSVHSAEVAFVFGGPLNNPTRYTVADQRLSQRMINIWTDFAKYGNPGEDDWEKFSRENQYFKELISVERKSYLEDHKKNCEFYRPFSGF